jgi:hypothetical protein
MRRIHLRAPALVLLLAACGQEGASTTCGIAAMTGPLIALEGFARGDGLLTPPTTLPPSLPARFVAGPTASALVSRDDANRLVAAVDGPAPEQSRPGFGVLLLDRAHDPLGILVHDGVPVRGAVQLGTVAVGDSLLPLLGVVVTPSAVETERCPLFPVE